MRLSNTSISALSQSKRRAPGGTRTPINELRRLVPYPVRPRAHVACASRFATRCRAAPPPSPPIAVVRRVDARPEELEPPSSSLVGSCRIQFDHGRATRCWPGRLDSNQRIRSLPKRALYQAELRPKKAALVYQVAASFQQCSSACAHESHLLHDGQHHEADGWALSQDVRRASIRTTSTTSAREGRNARVRRCGHRSSRARATASAPGAVRTAIRLAARPAAARRAESRNEGVAERRSGHVLERSLVLPLERDDTHFATKDVVRVIAALDAAGFDVVKTEGLY